MPKPIAILFDEAKRLILSDFPNCVVNREHIAGEPHLLGVAVFNATPGQEAAIEKRIADLEEQLCSDSRITFIPLVRNSETTAKYYTQYCSPSKLLAS